MLNLAVLEGRITKDLEIKMTQSDNKYVRFTLAVDRGGKDKGADFINCLAWNQTAELIYKYFQKGSPILIEGSIRTGSYEGKNGKVYSTDISVYKVHFPLTNKPKETDIVEEQMKNKEKAKHYSVDEVFGETTESNEVMDSDLPF